MTSLVATVKILDGIPTAAQNARAQRPVVFRFSNSVRQMLWADSRYGSAGCEVPPPLGAATGKKGGATNLQVNGTRRTTFSQSGMDVLVPGNHVVEK